MSIARARAHHSTENMTGLIERWMPRGDWRDFAAITPWASTIGQELGSSPPAETDRASTAG